MTKEKETKEKVLDDDFKIDKQFAVKEFDRFVDEMDLLLDESEMDQEDLTAFSKQKQRIVREIQRGDLIINENGEAVFTPSNKNSKYHEPLTFHERDGAALMTMDKKKKNHDMAKTYAVMGSLCRVHQNVFAGLKGNDIKVCEAVYVLLMD